MQLEGPTAAGLIYSDTGGDGDHVYLARTWLLDPHQVEDKAARPSRRKLRPWNGRDFYVILGRDEPGDPRWPIAHKYGFLNAGGGSWYWKPLRNLEPGHRGFAYVSGAGYVGIGRVTGTVIPARDAEVEIEGRRQPLLDQPDVSEAWQQGAVSEDTVRITYVGAVASAWVACVGGVGGHADALGAGAGRGTPYAVGHD